MFKMGCSMARKILAIDGKGSASSSSATATATIAGGASSSIDNANKKAKENQATPASGTKQQEELNDFSKLEEDPRLPLNVRQIFKITKSWKAIARTMSKTGTAMFLNLFEQNQDLFYLFDRFQHLKGKELHESMELREHAATVMSTLDQSINSLSDYDNFVTYLHSIGKLHRKVPGFKREHFWKIEQPFLKAVKQTLDERCNETIEEIYRIAIKLIIETIAEGYGEDQPDADGFITNDMNGNGNGSGSGNDTDGGGSGGPKDKSSPDRGKSADNHDKSTSGGGNGGACYNGKSTKMVCGYEEVTIRDQSGEMNGQRSDRCLLLERTRAVVRKSRRALGGYPIQGARQGQIGHRDKEESEPTGDRLKTTMICLKELLALVAKGVTEQQQQQRNLLGGCEPNRLAVETVKGGGEHESGEDGPEAESGKAVPRDGGRERANRKERPEDRLPRPMNGSQMNG